MAGWRDVADHEMRLSYRGLTEAFQDLDFALTSDERARVTVVTHQAVAAIMAGDVDAYALCHLEAHQIIEQVRTRREYRLALIAAHRPRIETVRALVEDLELHPATERHVQQLLMDAKDAICEWRPDDCDAALARIRERVAIECQWSENEERHA
jgi:hypothetical protein